MCLLVFFQALGALVFRFVLVLRDQLVDLLFFLGGLLRREGLVVFRDLPLDLLLVDHHDVEAARLGRLDLAVPFEFFLNNFLFVGVVVPFLLVLFLVGGNATDDFSRVGEGRSGSRGRGRRRLNRRRSLVLAKRTQ